jgi:hypothetical protein
MSLHCSPCDLELFAYLVVFTTLQQQFRDLLLPRSQLKRCFLHEFPQIRNAQTPGKHSYRTQSL